MKYFIVTEEHIGTPKRTYYIRRNPKGLQHVWIDRTKSWWEIYSVSKSYCFIVSPGNKHGQGDIYIDWELIEPISEEELALKLFK